MEVLPDCRVERGYDYTATTPQVERVAIRNEDELYARLPLGAARLEGDLKAAGSLEVSMTIVGTYRTAEADVTHDELVGRCDGATHVVAGFTVGAFRFSTGTSSELGGGVDVAGVGAGTKTRGEEQLLRRAGDEAKCNLARGDDTEPPFGCGALLRVEVSTVGAAKAVVAAPPETPPAVEPATPGEPPLMSVPPETTSEPAPTSIIEPPLEEPPPPLSPEPEPTPEPSAAPPAQGIAVTPASPPPAEDAGWGTGTWVTVGVVGALLVGGIVVGAVVAANREEEPPYYPEEGGLGSGAVIYSPVIEW